MLNQISFLELQRYASQLWPGNRLAIEPFSFPILVEDVADGVTVTTPYKILANCDFVLCSIAAMVLDGAADETVIDSLLQIVDTGSQERLFNTAAPFGSFANLSTPGGGSVNASQNLSGFRRYAGNSTLEVTVQGGLQIGAVPVDVEIVLHGALVYAYSS
jgi:hypothetical protein